MTLASTSFWSALATILRLGALLVIAKIMAATGGPTAVAMLGQFQSFLIIVMSFSGMLFRTGVVKYSAEFREDSSTLVKLLATAVRLAGVLVLIEAIVLIMFHQEMAPWLLNDANMAPLFLMVVIALPFFSANGISLGLLNGLGYTKHFLLINAGTAVINLLAIAVIVYVWGVDKALYGLLVGPALMGLIATVFLIGKRKAVLLQAFSNALNAMWVSNLGRFALMSLVMALVTPIVQIAVRNELAEQYGWKEVGYWQAVWQISNAYLAVITAGFTVYYLPKLSRLKEVEAIGNEMRKYYKTALPIVLFLSIIVYLLRDYILIILYSSEFKPAADLFAWQLAGDMVKVISWVMAYMLIAKSMTKLTIGSEVVFGLLIYLGNLWLIPHFGIQSPVIVYFFVYLLHAIFCWYVVGRHYLLQSVAKMNEG